MADDEAEWGHSWHGCGRRGALSRQAVDGFRRKIRFVESKGERTHSCFRCGISQRYCRTGIDRWAGCQWANRLVPIVRTAVGSVKGWEVIQKVGFLGEQGDLEEYGRWLGQRHIRQVWGEWMSNAMVVMIEVILYIQGKGKEENDKS